MGVLFIISIPSYIDYHGEMVLAVRALFQRQYDAYLVRLLNWIFMSTFE